MYAFCMQLKHGELGVEQAWYMTEQIRAAQDQTVAFVYLINNVTEGMSPEEFDVAKELQNR